MRSQRTNLKPARWRKRHQITALISCSGVRDRGYFAPQPSVPVDSNGHWKLISLRVCLPPSTYTHLIA